MDQAIDATLLDSESALWQMISRLPGMLWIANAAGSLNCVSPQWFQETGHGLNQLLGFAWQSLIHLEDQDKVCQQWATATAGTEAFELDFRFRCADGGYRWFSMRARPVLNPGGATSCWLGLCVDINDAKGSLEKLNIS